MYVACSRVTTLSGLHLLDLKPEAIKASASTKDEMKRLRSEMKFESFHDKLEKHPAHIRVLLLNIRFVQNKENQINSDSYLDSVNIMVLTETWKRNHSNINVTQFHYKYHSVRTGDRGGGVSVLDPMIQVRMEVSSNECTCNVIVLQCKVNDADILIIDVYRPPSFKFEKIMRWLTKVTSIIDRNMPTVIVGDFDVNLIGTTAASRGLQRAYSFYRGDKYTNSSIRRPPGPFMDQYQCYLSPTDDRLTTLQ